MKKFFSILLALALLSTLSVSAFAEGIQDTNISGNKQHDLTVKYDPAQQNDVYAATITWGAMTFTYEGQIQVWNTNTLQWDTTRPAGWKVDGTDADVITITNRSSKAIYAKIECNLENDKKDNAVFTVTAPEGTTQVESKGYEIAAVTVDATTGTGTEVTTKFTITPSGTYEVKSDNTNGMAIGKVTVTLS